jgi:hypothetical protein
MNLLNQAQAWASLIIAAATVLTLIVLIIYTRETYRLRKEAQAQTDQTIKPIVMLEGASDLPVIGEGANMPAFKAVLRNLGLGAAFNIEVEPLCGPNTKIEFRHTTSLAAGDRQPIWMRIWEDQRLADTVAYQSIQRMFHNHQLTSHASGVIRYSDVNGKRYRTVMTYHYDDLSKEMTPHLNKVEPNPES